MKTTINDCQSPTGGFLRLFV